MSKLNLDIITITEPDLKTGKCKIVVNWGDPYRDVNDELEIDFDQLEYWVSEQSRRLDLEDSEKLGKTLGVII